MGEGREGPWGWGGHVRPAARRWLSTLGNPHFCKRVAQASEDIADEAVAAQSPAPSAGPQSFALSINEAGEEGGEEEEEERYTQDFGAASSEGAVSGIIQQQPGHESSYTQEFQSAADQEQAGAVKEEEEEVEEEAIEYSYDDEEEVEELHLGVAAADAGPQASAAASAALSSRSAADGGDGLQAEASTLSSRLAIAAAEVLSRSGGIREEHLLDASDLLDASMGLQPEASPEVSAAPLSEGPISPQTSTAYSASFEPEESLSSRRSSLAPPTLSPAAAAAATLRAAEQAAVVLPAPPVASSPAVSVEGVDAEDEEAPELQPSQGALSGGGDSGELEAAAAAFETGEGTVWPHGRTP